MKRLLKFGLILLVVILQKEEINCQNFAPINSQWHYQDYRVDCVNIFFTKIESDRDTTIEDKLVTILEVYKNSIHIPEGRMYIHEEGNKIFFYEEGEFKLIYDFTLEAGDTVIVNIPKNRTYYDFSCSNGELSLINNKSKMIIDSISYTELQGQQLKVLHTRTDIYDEDNDCFNFGQVTERIGSEWGLFGWYCQQCLAGCTGNIRCYSDSLIDYKNVPENCDFGINSSTNNLLKHKLEIFPNPTKGNLFLDTDLEFKGYNILDLNGRILIQKDNFTGNQIHINSLKVGVYLLELLDKNGNLVFTQKVIKK